MSSLYDDASWLLIPEGIKEDVVYAQKPTNGLGDLQFTRASDATRTNSAGVIERTPWNLLTFSEMFSDAAWSKVGSGTGLIPVVTANVAVAPNGTMTADRIVFNAGASGASLISQDVAGGIGYTFSIYVKSNTSSSQNIQLRTNGLTSTTITVTTEWQRFTVTSIAWASAIRGVGLDLRSAVGTTADLLVWGAQFVEGTDAKPYFATTNRQDVPRLDYRNADGSLNSCPRLLLEPQRTNLALYSEQFETSWTAQTATITSNATTAPNGTLTADKLVAAVGLGLPAQHRIDQTSTSAAGNNTFSVYLKKGEIEFIFLRIGLSGAIVNLNNGAISQITAGIVASSVDAGNGWYRFIITKAASIANEVLRINLNQTATFTDFIGNGTDGAFIWGAQYEVGAYATTYIPTTTAAVTRLADLAEKTGVSSLIGQSQGTFFIECNVRAFAEVVALFALSDGTSLNRIRARRTAAQTITLERNLSGQSDQTVNFTSVPTSGSIKAAFAWSTAANGFAVYINGTGNSSSSALPMFTNQLSRISVGTLQTGGSSLGDGVTQAALFPTRLTNAQLAQITTL